MSNETVIDAGIKMAARLARRETLDSGLPQVMDDFMGEAASMMRRLCEQLADRDREIRARGEILDAIGRNIGHAAPRENGKWACCYDDSWRGLIVDEAYAHPAKMARELPPPAAVRHAGREGEDDVTAAQWLVLDNLLHNWPYWTNCDRGIADAAYLWCVENEYIKDGKVTDAGFCAKFVAGIGKLKN